MRLPRLVSWTLRLGLAGVYLFAAVPKILDPWAFARAIGNFRILPLDFVPAIAIWLPVLEGIAALALLTGLLLRGGAAVIAVSSAVFAGAILSAMVRGLDIDCGCFGKAASSSANLPHLGLNLATLAAALILLVAMRRGGTPRSPVPALRRPRPGG